MNDLQDESYYQEPQAVEKWVQKSSILVDVECAIAVLSNIPQPEQCRLGNGLETRLNGIQLRKETSLGAWKLNILWMYWDQVWHNYIEESATYFTNRTYSEQFIKYSPNIYQFQLETLQFTTSKVDNMREKYQ